ncbi:alpha/beta fold hydrolase [Cupriavidus respiraculi]|uniref:Aminoacrylate hydrolase RutD n=1 Tax=Cupriavidus respiraculi TaxID=195930 RepID=A0ABM8WDM5_9BURK|nr:alpha/beta hydrolase [Cupriavidus respiraculi]CAG9165384.1 Putative aminoacrylate hydrolase RutD [Cupriavidus respiraculi]
MSGWILLRGLTREARHWAELPAMLREHGVVRAQERIALIDLPGNGRHAATAAPATVAGMLASVRAEARATGISTPCRVLAMSLGGMVATAWAQQYPAEIERLVLVNTSMRPFSTAAQRLRADTWPDLLRLARDWHDAQRCEARIHRLTCRRIDRADADIAAWTAIRASAPVSRANALRQLFAAARYRAHAGPPACATLVLSSAADALVDPACSRTLARAWDTEHREHPWAGHDLPHDDPAWLAATVARWCAALDRKN